MAVFHERNWWDVGTTGKRMSRESQAKLEQVTQRIYMLCSEKRFAELDQELANLNPLYYERCELVSILRTSFAAKHELPNWSGARDRIKNEFMKRGLDASRLLRGLV